MIDKDVRPVGRILRWKGSFGFMEVDGIRRDVFVHRSELPNEEEPRVGEQFFVTIEEAPRGFQAVNCQRRTSAA